MAVRMLPQGPSKILCPGFICLFLGLIYLLYFPTIHQSPAPLTKCLWQGVAFSDRMLLPTAYVSLMRNFSELCLFMGFYSCGHIFQVVPGTFHIQNFQCCWESRTVVTNALAWKVNVEVAGG